ncbi:hypothetical protein QCA50_013711 [Cerrena zonata]|uniref:Uncharacterized protein n=1 Tax=Cerrena zonata TaxID=2478898 RepID=A0AAW0FTZ7_9APHY
MHLCNVPEKSQIAATVPSRGKRPISCSLILPRTSPGTWYHLITHSFLRCFGHTTSNYNKSYKTRSFTSYRDQQETTQIYIHEDIACDMVQCSIIQDPALRSGMV